MLTVAPLVVLSLGLLQQASADPTESLPGVYDLTPENFDKHITGAKDAIVEFYAPWCGHCKSLTPEYKKLGEAVSSDARLKSRVVIAKVNADEHKSLGTRFGVGGFPTLKYFSRGKPVNEPIDYSGGRTKDAFLEYINNKLTEDNGFARVEILDTLARQFTSASDTSDLIKKAQELAGSLTDEAKINGDVYLKSMQKAASKGMDWFSTEKARLERLLESGNVNTNKISEIGRKLSVLTAFDKEE
ncbi:hypothetical protein WJX84_002525 [Apatococcus fuscideae]|uniref:protein disulfide-isomerase n=1 Tax=Apatococcus fuscideae TaxID=2026836 RepID=A0AAW1TKU3_9CHLO